MINKVSIQVLKTMALHIKHFKLNHLWSVNQISKIWNLEIFSIDFHCTYFNGQPQSRYDMWDFGYSLVIIIILSLLAGLDPKFADNWKSGVGWKAKWSCLKILNWYPTLWSSQEKVNHWLQHFWISSNPNLRNNGYLRMESNSFLAIFQILGSSLSKSKNRLKAKLVKHSTLPEFPNTKFCNGNCIVDLKMWLLWE